MGIENEKLLKQVGFILMPHRGLWISHKHRRAFSVEAVSDYNLPDLEKFLMEAVPKDAFWFYFGGVVPDNFKHQGFEVLKELNLPDLQPEAAVARVGYTFSGQKL
jgi:hypothetical protein